MLKRTWLAGLLLLALSAAPAFGQQGRFSFTRLWTGEELQKLNLGGSKFAGDPKEWKSAPGVGFSYNYPGTGPLPAPIVVKIPLGRSLPLGHYRLYVKNFYRGKMEATLGDITKPLRIVRFDWTVAETFEINEPADQVTLRYFPSALVADTGARQSQGYILQGLFITTEANKVPKFASEIVELVTEDTPPARSGNYLENGGFEAGFTGWGKWYGSATPVLRPTNLDGSGPAEGRYALRLEVPANDLRFGVETKLYRVPAGRDYTLSFAARADRPLALRAYLNGISEDLKNYSSAGLAAAVNLTNEWQRFTVSGRLLNRPGFLYTLVINPQTTDDRPAVVWLDAVQLQEGAAAPFQPRTPREVGWLSATPGNVFYEREPARVELLVSGGGGNAAVDYQTVDFWGQVVDRGRQEVAGGRAAFNLYAGKRGLFRTTFTLGEALSELVYSVLPANPHLNEKYPAGTLGVDMGFTPYHLDILKRANFNWVISKSLARWYRVEPEAQGKYLFFDEAVRNADRANMMILLQTLSQGRETIPWLKDYVCPTGGAAWEPAKRAAYFKAWGDFIYALASHYKPYVNHWEIDNEPNALYQQPEHYAEALRIASREIRRANPQAKVIGFSGGGFKRTFYDPVVKNCPPENFDIVSVHFYGHANPDFATFLKEVGRPGWNTEVGSTGPTSFTSLPNFDSVKEKEYWQLLQGTRQANAVSDVRTYLSSMSVGGIEKYFYYFARFANCGPSQPTRWAGGGKELVEYDGSLRANAVGLSIASHFIDGGRYQGAVELDKTVTAHLYRKAAGTAGFFWVTEAKVFKAVPPAGFNFYDLMGNPIEPAGLRLTESPVYFTGPADPAAAAAALKTMRLEAAN